jgi:hypothetical protein
MKRKSSSSESSGKMLRTFMVKRRLSGPNARGSSFERTISRKLSLTRYKLNLAKRRTDSS